MEREVFVLPNGETFSAWDIVLSGMEEHTEKSPLKMHDTHGTFINEGIMTHTVKAGTIHFHAVQGTAQPGQSGQSRKESSMGNGVAESGRKF